MTGRDKYDLSFISRASLKKQFQSDLTTPLPRQIENGETEIETAIREIKEETSVNVMIDPTFRETVSYFPKRDTQKTVVYFIARAKNYDFVPQEEEIAEIRWVDIGYASTILTYENDKNIVNKAKAAIKEF